MSLNFEHFALSLFPDRMFDIRAVTHQMLVRKANREDPDQTEEAV